MEQLLDHPQMPTKKACKALRVKDNLTPLEAVMWLARSLPAPMLEGRSRPSRGAGTVATSRNESCGGRDESQALASDAPPKWPRPFRL